MEAARHKTEPQLVVGEVSYGAAVVIGSEDNRLKKLN